MIKQDLYVPTEYEFCVNHGFSCIQCCHYNPVSNGCGKIKITTSTTLPKKKTKDKTILKTVNDYKKVFDTLAKQGHGDKEVLFGYDSDVVYTGDYKLENIRIKKDTIKFNEYPEW